MKYDMRKLRKWKMWARIGQKDDCTADLSFSRATFYGLTHKYERIVRVEVRELPRKRRKR